MLHVMIYKHYKIIIFLKVIYNIDIWGKQLKLKKNLAF